MGGDSDRYFQDHPMAVSTAQIATELYQLSVARQDAETDHRRRLNQLDHLARSLLGGISASALDDPDLRAAVSALPGNGPARVLLHGWTQRLKDGKFDLSYYAVPVPVRVDDDEQGRARYELTTPMIRTLYSPPAFRRGPDGVRRPDPATFERSEAVVEQLCVGAGMVALNFDALGHGEETMIRAADGTWDHRGPAPHGVPAHRGTLDEAIRWFHHTTAAISTLAAGWRSSSTSPPRSRSWSWSSTGCSTAPTPVPGFSPRSTPLP